MLTKTQKRDWLEALRSGEYKQTKGYLCRDNGRMCCLGVLFDVTQDADWERAGDSGPWSANGDDSLFGGPIIGDEMTATLSNMNDGQKEGMFTPYRPPCSFSEIADYIEENL